MLNQYNNTINKIKQWAYENQNIQAILLTSSRASNSSNIDFLSDYDIEVFVSDISPFLRSDNWLKYFGEPLIWWPYTPKTTFNDRWITRLVLFDTGIRIDFQITLEENNNPLFIDYGYKILVDKKHIFKNISSSTYSRYNIKKPSKVEYDTVVNDFWWNSTYVAKSLWRKELPYVGFMISQIRYQYLHTIIDYYIGLKHNWNINVGVHGKLYKKYLEKELWKQYKQTYSNANYNNLWSALYKLINLFSTLSLKLSEKLGYTYPIDKELKLKEYYKFIQDYK